VFQCGLFQIKKNRSCVEKTSAARLVTLLKSRYPSHCKSSVQFCLLCCQPEPVSESLHCQAKFGAVCTAPSLQPASLAGTQLPTQYTTVRLRSLRSCNPSAKVCDRKIPHLCLPFTSALCLSFLVDAVFAPLHPREDTLAPRWHARVNQAGAWT